MTYGHLMTEDLPYKPLYFRPGSLRLAPDSKYSNLIGTSQYSIAYISVIISQMELKFVIISYFKQLFQNIRQKLQYSKNRIFVTSHFGTLLNIDLPTRSLKVGRCKTPTPPLDIPLQINNGNMRNRLFKSCEACNELFSSENLKISLLCFSAYD